MKPTADFRVLVKYTLTAAIGAAVVNNLYNVIYGALAGVSVPEVIHLGSITAMSILPVVFAGVLFFILEKYLRQGVRIFLILGTIFTLVSLGGPFAAELPDGTAAPEGFAMLTFPMHIVTGLAALLIIPKAAQKQESQTAA